jgi:hypothetical protein
LAEFYGRRSRFFLRVASVQRLVPLERCGQDKCPAERSSRAAYQTCRAGTSFGRPLARHGTAAWTLHPGTLRRETPADSGKARYSPDGSRHCCCGSSARSCYGWHSGRSTLDCLTSRRATHGYSVAALWKLIVLDIGEELTGLIADWDALSPFGGGEEVVAGEPVVDLFLGIAVVDDLTCKPKHIGVFDLSRHKLLENGVVQRGKELADVRFEDVTESAGELLAALHGGMSALAAPASVRASGQNPERGA